MQNQKHSFLMYSLAVRRSFCFVFISVLVSLRPYFHLFATAAKLKAEFLCKVCTITTYSGTLRKDNTLKYFPLLILSLSSCSEARCWWRYSSDSFWHCRSLKEVTASNIAGGDWGIICLFSRLQSQIPYSFIWWNFALCQPLPQKTLFTWVE